MKVYSRSKYVSCEKTDEYTLETKSSIIDTIHEMEVVIVTDMKENVIIQARSQMVRAPYKICFEVCQLASGLAGLKIDQNIGKNVREIMGGPCGCFHLQDLSLEAVVAIKHSSFAFTADDRAQRLRKADPVLRGTCYTHSRPLEERIGEALPLNMSSDSKTYAGYYFRDHKQIKLSKD